MSMATEIKNKEDSLIALMNRVLKEPLKPLGEAINTSMEAFQEAIDKLDDIESSISANGIGIEDMGKSLRRILNDIKDEVLPNYKRDMQEKINEQLEVGSKEVQCFINTQQKSIDALMSSIETHHNNILNETRAINDFGKFIVAEVNLQCTTLNQDLVDSIRNATRQIKDKLVSQQNVMEKSHQALLELLSHTVSDCSAIQQSLIGLAAEQGASGRSLSIQTKSLCKIIAQLSDIKQAGENAVENSQSAIAEMLSENNLVLLTHIERTQTKLRALAVVTTVSLVAILGYIGYDTWSKFY